MDWLTRSYTTLRVRLDDAVCFVQMYRAAAGNAINEQLIADLTAVLRDCEAHAKIVVLEGLPDVFCNGADFREIQSRFDGGGAAHDDPGPLYDLWLRLAQGPFMTIAHVRGRANAGGVGFVAACDLVVSDEKAVFSLSELLFGVMPACVLPFLVRRIGAARANAMTLTTQPVSAAQAKAWGLVDVCDANTESTLRILLLRLRRLERTAIARYKRYATTLDGSLAAAKPAALAANVEVFSDPHNLRNIARYVSTGRFPWEAS
ncbi:enoyl-CoA hydratase/isomerase [Paraburkholderia humisilvae]|uniref:Putative polyketide biosynthesis enoyl-CoA hydratase PksH n=1 Tax=Paraburkholderia humisilvae TaxID=627669 RepID=A0A6J5EJA1_9BURK|nr:enoyl-CoA hydratase/isomerase [Paraburkholderia humisilvae]CAB3765807.1 putative polyketide biosynthesis enoyl-CoA hydratase PksH [Paraburkholderia humisilvae]